MLFVDSCIDLLYWLRGRLRMGSRLDDIVVLTSTAKFMYFVAIITLRPWYGSLLATYEN